MNRNTEKKFHGSEEQQSVLPLCVLHSVENRWLLETGQWRGAHHCTEYMGALQGVLGDGLVGSRSGGMRQQGRGVGNRAGCNRMDSRTGRKSIGWEDRLGEREVECHGLIWDGREEPMHGEGGRESPNLWMEEERC